MGGGAHLAAFRGAQLAAFRGAQDGAFRGAQDGAVGEREAGRVAEPRDADDLGPGRERPHLVGDGREGAAHRVRPGPARDRIARRLTA